MRKTIIAGTAVALSLAFAGTASADTTSTDFESMTPGTVNSQELWKSADPSTVPLTSPWADHGYDQAIVGNLPAEALGFGEQALRISNAYTSGEFDYQTYSKPVDNPAGEAESSKVLISEFSFISTKPDEYQPGLNQGISQTDSGGARMSYVRLQDGADGVRVYYTDTPNQYVADWQMPWNERWIATLDRKVPHTIRIESKFIPGNDNDVVKVYIDNAPKVCGTTWENWYKYVEMMEAKEPKGYVNPSDRLMWRNGGAAIPVAPSVKGEGFLFDNVSNTSQAEGGPEACLLPKGDKGDKGEPGFAVAGGSAAIIHTPAYGPKLTGNTLRVIHAPKYEGMKLVSLRALLRTKPLPVSVKRHTVKVDLRGRTVGNYNVYVSAKYRTKGGKVRIGRFMRALSVTRAPLDAPR